MLKFFLFFVTKLCALNNVFKIYFDILARLRTSFLKMPSKMELPITAFVSGGQFLSYASMALIGL